MKIQKVLSTTLILVMFNPLIAFAGDRDRFPRNMTCRTCVQESIAPRPPQPTPPRTQPTPPRRQSTPPRPQPTPQRRGG